MRIAPLLLSVLLAGLAAPCCHAAGAAVRLLQTAPNHGSGAARNSTRVNRSLGRGRHRCSTSAGQSLSLAIGPGRLPAPKFLPLSHQPERFSVVAKYHRYRGTGRAQFLARREPAADASCLAYSDARPCLAAGSAVTPSTPDARLVGYRRRCYCARCSSNTRAQTEN